MNVWPLEASIGKRNIVSDQVVPGQANRYAIAARSWASVISFLMIHEFDQRFRGSRFGAILAILEPILLIGLLIFLRGFVRDRLPTFGTSIFVFYSSGIFPFYVFIRLSYRARRTRYDGVQRLPRVGTTALLIASVLAEAVLILSMMLIWFFALWALGDEEAAPVSILDCAIPVALLAAIGVGAGLVNSAISRRSRLWTYVYARASRGLLIISGVFFVADLLPYHFRSIVVWNPLLHAIEWFRLGLYGSYPHYTLERDYLAGWALGLLFGGLLLYQATLRSSPRR